MSAKKEMQQIDQFHQARMMNEQAMLMTQALNAAANDDREVIEEEDTGILKELFADVQDKGFVLSKSWGELLCSLSKYQGKLMVTENSYVERERKIKEQEQKLKQQTQSWPEEVLQLQSALSRKEKTLAACQAELVHVNKMAELVDAEHNRTKEILEKVLREKSEVEEKSAQYEIDLNSMSQKLQASQEELEIKDQLVVKLEQQMVKEIADSMQEMTSLKGLLESREELLEDEKKAHDETNIKLRQLQISYQALKRNLDSSPEYLQMMPMMPYHDNTRMMSPHQVGDMAYYTTPGCSNTQLWRPVPMRSDASYSGGPPSKVRRVVTSSSTTEEDGHTPDKHSTAPDVRDEGACPVDRDSTSWSYQYSPYEGSLGKRVQLAPSKTRPVGVKNKSSTSEFDKDESSNSGNDISDNLNSDDRQAAADKPTKRVSGIPPKRFSPERPTIKRKRGPQPGWKQKLLLSPEVMESSPADTHTLRKKPGPKPGWKQIADSPIEKGKPGPKPKKAVDEEEKKVRKKPGPKPNVKKDNDEDKNIQAHKKSNVFCSLKGIRGAGKPIECHKCHQMQPSITALQIHIKKKHPSQRPYKCGKCGHGMKYYYQMKTHEKSCPA